MVVQASRPSVNLVPEGYDGRFRTFATVLQSAEHGPQFCHAVQTSLPPGCGGPAVAGWDWDTVKSESAGGSRWGSYVLVGTFDGKTFTLTEPAVVDDGSIKRPTPRIPELITPCPEPSGGWRPVDPAKATNPAYEATTVRAEAENGFGGLWIDQQYLDDKTAETEAANDPARFILNVTTTGDVAALERKLREIWGGSLCVSKAARTEAQLLTVQAALTDVPGMVSNGPDITSGQLVVDLRVATTELQRELDERFENGTVRLQGAMAPID